MKSILVKAVQKIYILKTKTNIFAESLTLKSKDMIGQISIYQIFNGFRCSGKNISPQLSWDNAPKEAKSFAVTVYDPDAPTGIGWWHWVRFDIPKETKKILSTI